MNRLCNEILAAGLGAISSAGGGYTSAYAALLKEVESTYEASLEGVALFGSTVRGEETEESDVDLLIVLRKGSAIDRSLYDRWDEAFGKEDRKVSPHFVAFPVSVNDVGSLWYEVALEGVVLLDREGTLGRFLAAIRRRMAEGVIQRKWSSGHPYWVEVE